MLPIVIVGSGHAGLTLVRELRQKDKDCPIILVSKEKVEAYYKPNLSKALTLGKTAEDLVLKPADVLALELNIEIIQEASVEEISAQDKSLLIENCGNEQIYKYQQLVLCLGAQPVRLPISGPGAEDVLSVNSLQDYRIFREVLGHAQRVAIIGAGFVGTEFASDLSQAGHKVDVIDLGDWPLQKATPKKLGLAIAESFPSEQVSWHFGTEIKSIDKRADKLVMSLENGTVLNVDVILSAVGIVPNTELAKRAGIKTKHGIVVDQYSQTNVPEIYALGDCAEFKGQVAPFIAPATAAAKSLAKTLLGCPTPLNNVQLPVAVKVATCPTVISTAPVFDGQWLVEGEGLDLIARYEDSEGRLKGFALTGKALSHKSSLAQELIEHAQLEMA